MRFRTAFSFLLAALLFSGCSALSSAPSPELRQTLISLSNRYLQAVISGNDKVVAQMIYWPEYMDDASFTRVEFDQQFRSIQGRWNAAKHPLVGLQVTSVRSSGNEATVRLKKDAKHAEPGASSPEIRIDLLWAGTGWMVKDDSLFGSDELFADMLENQKG